jgi:hypothetical protein
MCKFFAPQWDSFAFCRLSLYLCANRDGSQIALLGASCGVCEWLLPSVLKVLKLADWLAYRPQYAYFDPTHC